MTKAPNHGNDHLTVALAQITPVWLDRDGTLEKMIAFTRDAAARDARLIAFGEALLPGYPFWSERTDGARFDSAVQKDLHAYYQDQAVCLERGDLDPLCRAAQDVGVAVYAGIIERAGDRGGHSLYCSLVYIDAAGRIRSVHRKLQPTYDERLNWAPGDGHGLRVHPLGPFTVGGLNCWENWMPLPRAALYALGEDLHVAVWPGSRRNTEDITRFIARESRSYVLSASGLMRAADVPSHVPHAARIIADDPEGVYTDGGSCIAGPDGAWIVEPADGAEQLTVATLDHAAVRRERQNFDPVGHYARPDVTQLLVDRRRQTTATFTD